MGKTAESNGQTLFFSFIWITCKTLCVDLGKTSKTLFESFSTLYFHSEKQILPLFLFYDKHRCFLVSRFTPIFQGGEKMHF